MPEHDLGTRLQALTLLEHGVPQATVTTITGISKTQVYALREAAMRRVRITRKMPGKASPLEVE